MSIQLVTLLALAGAVTAIPTRQEKSSTCSNDRDISHYWGNFSPYYGPSSIPDPPSHCQVDFVQVLSRHGSRFPETAKTEAYKSFVSRLQSSIKDRSSSDLGEYAFLKDYKFELGAERLTPYGEDEMEYSGKTFRKYYSHLLQDDDPVQGFVRASDINTAGRVYKSGEFFVKGGDISHNPFVFMMEAKEISNPLWNYMCPAFSLPPNSNVATEAMDAFKKTWVPQITARLNHNLHPFVFNDADTISLMEMCPFTTNAASSFGDVKNSQFCQLFSLDEWKNYEYLRTLYIQYGFGSSNPLGATRGSPWVQELVARMTNRPIVNNTHYGGVNMTLDSNPETFPLGKKVYLDFTHETDLVSIYAALGLYPDAKRAIGTSERVCAEEAGGYTASQVVPFGARMYVEKMRCSVSTGSYGRFEDRVRIVVNDRVMRLGGCRADKHGTCRLDRWLKTQKFALSGGWWKRCVH